MTLTTLSFGEPIFLSLLCVVLIAGFIRGFTGFGFSAFVILCLSFFFSPVEIIPFNVILDGSLGIYLLYANYKRVSWRYIAQLMPGIIIVTPISMYLLKSLPLLEARIAVACSVVLLCGFSWWANFSVSPKYKTATLLGMGGIAGFFSGLVSMGGIPAAMGLLWVNKTVDTIRATMIMLLFLIDLNSIFTVWHYDLLYANLWILWAACFPLAGIGIALGAWSFRRCGIRYYRQGVYALLIGIALFSLQDSLRSVFG